MPTPRTTLTLACQKCLNYHDQLVLLVSFAKETKMFPERMKQSVKCGVAVRQLTDAHVLCYAHFYVITVDFRDREPSDGLLLKTTQAPFMCFHLLSEMYEIRR